MLTEFVIEDYKVQSTGADGGHYYILTIVEYNGKIRKLIVLFAKKSDELKLKENLQIRIKGKLEEDGENLILFNSELE
ncbi:hypothetical protein [Lacinutrix himadriensis]|uniref:hypothetical protein n=1 Tax=Lacinutrix himadriensis TaxID=641549 RepID=UPI0006E42660|nr:hypothetical protein [Lacinutrix himadriensis]